MTQLHQQVAPCNRLPQHALLCTHALSISRPRWGMHSSIAENWQDLHSHSRPCLQTPAAARAAGSVLLPGPYISEHHTANQAGPNHTARACCQTSHVPKMRLIITLCTSAGVETDQPHCCESALDHKSCLARGTCAEKHMRMRAPPTTRPRSCTA